MKLYTEEQVIEMIKLLLLNKAIELPSDEEIWEIADKNYRNYESDAFADGAKWMRDKIQGGNK